jgi:hypothetical protein
MSALLEYWIIGHVWQQDWKGKHIHELCKSKSTDFDTAFDASRASFGDS